MATGRLCAVDVPATTNTAIYTVPVTKTASCTLNLCNRSTSSVAVRVAMAATGTPANGEWIEYEAVIAPNGVLERTGLVAQAGQIFVVYASVAGVSAVIYGFEE